MLSFCSSGVPVLLFKPRQSYCSVVWLPLEAISGTAVAGLVSAMCSTGLKHIPGLCPCWGPAQPSLQAPLLVSPFLCLCTSLAALSLLPTLGFLCDLLELKHKLEKDKPLGIAQAVLRSTRYGDSFLDVLILVLY